MQKMLGYMRKTIQEFDMIQDGDRIAVGVSGGKDSLVLLKGLIELRRFIGIDYDVVAITLDPRFGGVEGDYSSVAQMCSEAGVEYRLIPTDIGQIVFDIRKELNPCSLCAKLRRGALHNAAKDAGCNKIALGHHFDDVIETILMGIIYGGQVQTMMPKLHSDHFEGMQLIRPMYLIREEEIKHWCRYNDLHFIQCACRFTDTCTTCDPDGRTVSKRMEIKRLISVLAKGNPQIEKNIFRSVESVNLSKVISYKKDGEIHSFLDGYDD